MWAFAILKRFIPINKTSIYVRVVLDQVKSSQLSDNLIYSKLFNWGGHILD